MPPPTPPPIIADMKPERIIAAPAPMRENPNPHTTNGTYASCPMPTPVTFPAPAGGGLTRSPTRPAISVVYRNTKRPAPIRTSPMTTIAALRLPVLAPLGRMEPRDTSRPPRLRLEQHCRDRD